MPGRRRAARSPTSSSSKACRKLAATRADRRVAATRNDVIGRQTSTPENRPCLGDQVANRASYVPDRAVSAQDQNAKEGRADKLPLTPATRKSSLLRLSAARACH